MAEQATSMAGYPAEAALAEAALAEVAWRLGAVGRRLEEEEAWRAASLAALLGVQAA